jgi:nickel/cobalt exporter
MKTLILSALCASCWLLPAHAEENPFLPRRAPAAASAAPSPQRTESVDVSPWKQWLEQTQYTLNQELASRTRAAKTGSAPEAWAILMALAFAYGAFHSLGPGHGKCLICSYFVAEQSTLRQGLVLGYLVAIIHATSALAVVSLLYLLLRGSGQMVLSDATRWTSIAGYGLIAAMGGWLLWRALRPERPHDHTHSHGEECHQEGTECTHVGAHAEPHRGEAHRPLWLMALGIGAVPCPGALTLLMFSISLDFLQLGVVLAAMIALGMGVTTTLMAIATILGRQGTLHMLTQATPVTRARAEKWLRVAGACCTLGLGLAFLTLSL